MLLKNYEKKILKAECNPEFQSVHVKAYLNENIEDVLPYLNSALGGSSYYKDPPAVTFKNNRRLITVQGDEIAINALKDMEEANQVLRWLVDEINTTWKNRKSITPSCESVSKPNMIDILKHLPKTNCGKCSCPTCMVFVTRVMDGILDENDCPELEKEPKALLREYLGKFSFDI